MSPRQPKREPDELDKKILHAIRYWIEHRGMPPTVREIQEYVKASSTSVVDYHLRRLERMKFISRDNNGDGARKARNIRLLRALPHNADRSDDADFQGLAAFADQKYGMPRKPTPREKAQRQMVAPASNTVTLPVAGQIVASAPIPPFPQSSPDETVEVPQSLLPRTASRLYALRVSGNSMIDALIGDGDIVVLQETKEAAPGEMVAAWFKDTEESTLKRFQPEFKDDQLQRVILKPANPTMEPIVVEDPSRLEIQGKVVLVIRAIDSTIRKPTTKVG